MAMRLVLVIGACAALTACANQKPAERADVQHAPASTQVPATGWKSLTSSEGNYIVAYTTDPAPLPLNEPFSINVTVRSAQQPSRPVENISLDVDGRMPHHRHGMNRQPRIVDHGDGTYLIEGMLFHMPGRWELYFDITRGGITERAQDVIFLD